MCDCVFGKDLRFYASNDAWLLLHYIMQKVTKSCKIGEGNYNIWYARIVKGACICVYVVSVCVHVFVYGNNFVHENSNTSNSLSKDCFLLNWVSLINWHY